MTTLKQLEQKRNHLLYVINYLKEEIEQIDSEIRDTVEAVTR